MIILAGDSSYKSCSVAVSDDGKILGEIVINVGMTHSKTFFKAVDEAITMSGISASQIDGIGVTVGPGSFTGVRIAVSGLKEMAYALGKPVWGVSSLYAAAYPFITTSQGVLYVEDARNDRVFAGGYYKGGKFFGDEAIEWDALLSDIPSKIKMAGIRDLLIVGDGVLTLGERLEYLRKSVDAVVNIESNAIIRASSVASIVSDVLIPSGDRGDKDIMPVYLVSSQAERMFPNKEINEGTGPFSQLD